GPASRGSRRRRGRRSRSAAPAAATAGPRSTTRRRRCPTTGPSCTGPQRAAIVRGGREFGAPLVVRAATGPARGATAAARCRGRSVLLHAPEGARETGQPGLLPGDAGVVLVVVERVAAARHVHRAGEHVHAVVHPIGEARAGEQAMGLVILGEVLVVLGALGQQ